MRPRAFLLVALAWAPPPLHAAGPTPARPRACQLRLSPLIGGAPVPVGEAIPDPMPCIDSVDPATRPGNGRLR